MASYEADEAGYAGELMARAGAAPPPTFGDIWRANWRATGLDTLTGSGQPLEDAFNNLVDTAAAKLGRPIPQAAQEAGLDWYGARGLAERANIIGQLTGALPDADQKALAPLLDFRARAAETAAALERDAADVNGRTYGLSGSATGWLAGLARQMVDPANLAMLAAPGGGEAGLFVGAARTAGMAAVGQAIQEPAIQRNRAELGLESGLSRAASDVADVAGGTFATAVGLPLLFRGAGFVARKVFGRPQVEAPAAGAPAEAAPLLALPHPDQFAETIIPPNFNAPRLLPPPAIAPDVFMTGRDLAGRLEAEGGAAMPVMDMRNVRLASEEAALRERDGLLANNSVGQLPEGAQAASDLLARVQELDGQAAAATGADRKALLDRRDELLANTTPDALAEKAAPLEQRRVMAAERAAIADRLNAIDEERARIKAERLGAGTPMLGQRMPARIDPGLANADLVHLVAPHDYDAAALLADRDMVIGTHPAIDQAAARVERGEPLPPRNMGTSGPAASLRPRQEAPARISELPFPAEEKTAPPKPAEPAATREPPGQAEPAAPKAPGNPQLAADAARVLEEVGDMRITLQDENGGVREISARDALAEVADDAAATRELLACIGGVVEGLA